MHTTQLIISTLLLTCVTAGTEILSSGTNSRLVARREPIDVCSLADGHWQWVGHFCDTCDATHRGWVQLCWQMYGTGNWAFFPSDWATWGAIEHATPEYGFKVACIDERLRRPDGMNRQSLPQDAGYPLADKFSCPFDYECRQVVDLERDAHVFCVAKERSPGTDGWDLNWRSVDGRGGTHIADPADMVEEFWMPGWHPSQRPASPNPRDDGPKRDHIAMISGDPFTQPRD